MGIIDAHVHIWTDDTAHYPLGAGWKKEDMKPARFTPEDLFKHTKKAGVDRIVLIQMSYYYPKDLSSRTGSGFDNRYMLDMMACTRASSRARPSLIRWPTVPID
jgi:hypothetical protein